MLKTNLKEIRMREFMMNSRQFCKFLGIAESQYHKYEKLDTQPILETALVISKKLGKRVEEIWFIADVVADGHKDDNK